MCHKPQDKAGSPAGTVILEADLGTLDFVVEALAREVFNLVEILECRLDHIIQGQFLLIGRLVRNNGKVELESMERH